MKKILLSSDCYGNFEKLFAKVRELHSKNNFDMMLMTGRVCVAQSTQSFKKIVNGQIKVPIPTYFIDCSEISNIFGQVYPQGKQIAPNLIFLGKIGIKLIEGIKVCYVNGQDINQNSQRYQKIYNEPIKDNAPRESFEKFISRLQYKGSDFTYSEIRQLIQSHQSNLLNSIDILLTNQWPLEFEHPQMIEVSKSQTISQLCYQLSPKYHIVSSGVQYFRRNPFKNKKNDSVTHFINVAEIQPSCKQLPKDKYLVAIQIDPMNTQNNTQNIEECPFSQQTRKAQHQNKDIENQDPEAQARNQQFISSNQDRIKEIIEKKKATKKQETKKQLNQNSYIYFEGFPQEVSDRQISQFLERWGEIKQLQVDKKSNSKFYRTGICRFRDLESAQICLSDSNRYTLYQSRIKFSIKQQNQKYRVEDCYLCVGKPNFDESLVVYIGKFCYIAIDKGAIQKHHFQIVPINHVANSRQLEEQQKRQINSLKQMLIQSTKNHKLTLLSYERYANLSYEINHCIIHCIPIDMTEQMMLDRVVNVNISNRYGLVESREGLAVKKGNQTQFYIKMSINKHQFIKYLQRKDKDVQLSRQMICQIIQKPEKLNWRDCIISPKQITSSIEFVRKLIKNV